MLLIKTVLFPGKIKEANGTGFIGNISKIACGYDFMLALDNSGGVWSWEATLQRNLALVPPTRIALFPVQVKDSTGSSLLSGITAISAGGNGSYGHSLALDSSNNVWAWGSDANGQLGDNDGTDTDKSLPVQVLDSAGALPFV